MNDIRQAVVIDLTVEHNQEGQYRRLVLKDRQGQTLLCNIWGSNPRRGELDTIASAFLKGEKPIIENYSLIANKKGKLVFIEQNNMNWRRGEQWLGKVLDVSTDPYYKNDKVDLDIDKEMKQINEVGVEQQLPFPNKKKRSKYKNVGHLTLNEIIEYIKLKKDIYVKQ